MVCITSLGQKDWLVGCWLYNVSYLQSCWSTFSRSLALDKYHEACWIHCISSAFHSRYSAPTCIELMRIPSPV
ncbi:hypothetical protein EYC80_008144 [Monilinia laxa]|uniref:Uncharacterized protein n=1 Tax=Monilinia laxa TaxID=61186 RepID=A0A5N6JUB3_MONLA|nr:hypothetical protein EYC80_008144 [Monilinia laxa]